MSFDCAAALSSGHARSPEACSAPASRNQRARSSEPSPLHVRVMRFRSTAVGSVWADNTTPGRRRTAPSPPATTQTMPVWFGAKWIVSRDGVHGAIGDCLPDGLGPLGAACDAGQPARGLPAGHLGQRGDPIGHLVVPARRVALRRWGERAWRCGRQPGRHWRRACARECSPAEQKIQSEHEHAGVRQDTTGAAPLLRFGAVRCRRSLGRDLKTGWPFRHDGH